MGGPVASVLQEGLYTTRLELWRLGRKRYDRGQLFVPSGKRQG